MFKDHPNLTSSHLLFKWKFSSFQSNDNIFEECCSLIYSQKM